MIDVVRAITAATSVQAPSIVYCADTKCLSMCTPICFGVGNLLASVFSNLSTRLESFRGETALSVYGGIFDRQAWRKF